MILKEISELIVVDGPLQNNKKCCYFFTSPTFDFRSFLDSDSITIYTPLNIAHAIFSIHQLTPKQQECFKILSRGENIITLDDDMKTVIQVFYFMCDEQNATECVLFFESKLGNAMYAGSFRSSSLHKFMRNDDIFVHIKLGVDFLYMDSSKLNMKPITNLRAAHEIVKLLKSSPGHKIFLLTVSHDYRELLVALSKYPNIKLRVPSPYAIMSKSFQIESIKSYPKSDANVLCAEWFPTPEIMEQQFKNRKYIFVTFGERCNCSFGESGQYEINWTPSITILEAYSLALYVAPKQVFGIERDIEIPDKIKNLCKTDIIAMNREE